MNTRPYFQVTLSVDDQHKDDRRMNNPGTWIVQSPVILTGLLVCRRVQYS